MKRTRLTIWEILTLSCEQSTRLMSESLDQQLPWTQRLAYRLHAVVCRSCRRFLRQIRFLRNAAEQCNHPPGASAETGAGESFSLSPEARQRLEQAVREADERD